MGKCQGSEPVCLEDLAAEAASALLDAQLFDTPQLLVNLPEGALSHVFGHLRPTARKAVLLSCKRWRAAALASATSLDLQSHDGDATEWGGRGVRTLQVGAALTLAKFGVASHARVL
ncbi:MAG: hypothetical protein WDW38_010286 [Sanguina aurantia]